MRYLFLLFLLGCNASLTRSHDVPSWMRAEWGIAQELSFARTFKHEVFDIHPEHFVIEEVDGAFDCGGVSANGCFVHGAFIPARIQWNTETPQVIRHEAQHAILWKLKHPDFKCVEHTC